MNILGSYNYKVVDNLARLTKEPEMPVSTECRDGATIISQNTEGTIDEDYGCWIRPEIPPPMLHEIASLRPARIAKILEVRERLARGTYDLDERLDAVLEHLLKVITTLDNTDNRSR